jgi:hypothetical protein
MVTSRPDKTGNPAPPAASARVVSASPTWEDGSGAPGVNAPRLLAADATRNQTRNHGMIRRRVAPGVDAVPVASAASAVRPRRKVRVARKRLIGMIIVVGVSLTITAEAPAEWPQASPAATTDEVSLIAVPLQRPNWWALLPIRCPSTGNRNTAPVDA